MIDTSTSIVVVVVVVAIVVIDCDERDLEKSEVGFYLFESEIPLSKHPYIPNLTGFSLTFSSGFISVHFPFKSSVDDF